MKMCMKDNTHKWGYKQFVLRGEIGFLLTKLQKVELGTGDGGNYEKNHR